MGQRTGTVLPFPSWGLPLISQPSPARYAGPSGRCVSASRRHFLDSLPSRRTIYGPRGIGALWLRRKARAVGSGGGKADFTWDGNLAGAVGMARAIELLTSKVGKAGGVVAMSSLFQLRRSRRLGRFGAVDRPTVSSGVQTAPHIASVWWSRDSAEPHACPSQRHRFCGRRVRQSRVAMVGPGSSPLTPPCGFPFTKDVGDRGRRSRPHPP